MAKKSKSKLSLVDQLFNSSEKRLARALLLLADFGKDGKQEPVIAKVSQETLADMIGTTRSRVSHFMNKFRQLGYINYNGDLEVHSSLLDAVWQLVLADNLRPECHRSRSRLHEYTGTRGCPEGCRVPYSGGRPHATRRGLEVLGLS
jgi:hypothetical protein